jgi:hypothetical protein
MTLQEVREEVSNSWSVISIPLIHSRLFSSNERQNWRRCDSNLNEEVVVECLWVAVILATFQVAMASNHRQTTETRLEQRIYDASAIKVLVDKLANLAVLPRLVQVDFSVLAAVVVGKLLVPTWAEVGTRAVLAVEQAHHLHRGKRRKRMKRMLPI